MDLRGLNYFIKLAECLNFTRAAEECYITQTAMSLHIAKMEEELGFQLFSRNNRNVELTPAGKVFYDRTKTMLAYYADSVKTASDTATGNIGSVQIAVSSCIDGLLMMPRFRTFRQQNPDVSLSVSSIYPGMLFRAVKSKEVDAVIGWSYERPRDEALRTALIEKFDLRIVVSKRHPLSKLDRIPTDQLKKYAPSIIELDGVPNVDKVMRNLSAYREAGKEFSRVKTIEEILFYVQLDNAVAILPSFIENNATGEICFKPFAWEKQPQIEMRIGFLTNNINPSLPTVIEVLTDSSLPLQR